MHWTAQTWVGGGLDAKNKFVYLKSAWNFRPFQSICILPEESFFWGSDEDELAKLAHFIALEITSRNQGLELSSGREGTNARQQGS